MKAGPLVDDQPSVASTSPAAAPDGGPRMWSSMDQVTESAVEPPAVSYWTSSKG